ncbi:MAG: hypothetical protein K8R74_14660 [Bacteroidales bacterium]|nr:hypothetical protein [Bacteroidales bacterium]
MVVISKIKAGVIYFLFVSLLLSPTLSFPQKPTKVKLVKANDLKYDKRLGKKVQRLIGNVILKQDSTLLFCDSAYLYELTNSFKGFGNVHIKASDSLNIFSDLLDYNGNTKMAELHHNVRLEESRATLYTEHLWYNRQDKIAYYLTGGKIIDSTNQLTSKKGFYYTDTREAFFKDSVVLINERYTIESDTLKYQTGTEISFFYGPTTIISEENYIYCENGWYDTKNDKSLFKKNAYIITEEQKLSGDSLYYNRLLDYGEAYSNVSLTDTIQDINIQGQYGEFTKREGFAFVTDSAMAVLIDNNDSLFLHSDTLWILFDKEQNVEYMLGYHHTKFFRSDMQGMCDSLVYSFKDSTIFMYNSPIIWSEQNQLSADSIHIAMSNNQIDTLALVNSCFIISMDDTIKRNTFNQIKGKVMIGYFKDNELVKISVFGNAESVFYLREENGDLIGINKTISSDMNIYMSDNELQSITPIRNVDAHMYPVNEVPEEDKKMKGFKWIEGQRPMKKEDIFIWESL